MKVSYRRWLEEQKYVAGTIDTQMFRAGRVERHHGSLDEHYAGDHMASLIDSLRYSTDDERRQRPNPSKIPFEGDIRNNLASYRNAVERYRRFRDTEDDDGETEPRADPCDRSPENEIRGFGLERDMQAALRLGIDQLEPGLIMIDDGAERSVSSGFIDITARDASGTTVVIELKTGAAGQRAVAQILSYMGDIAAEDESGKVRGILVASSFDAKAQSATTMVPNLILRKYNVRFLFSDGQR